MISFLSCSDGYFLFCPALYGHLLLSFFWKWFLVLSCSDDDLLPCPALTVISYPVLFWLSFLVLSSSARSFLVLSCSARSFLVFVLACRARIQKKQAKVVSIFLVILRKLNKVARGRGQSSVGALTKLTIEREETGHASFMTSFYDPSSVNFAFSTMS